MSARALRIGLVGCGRWGGLILRDLVAVGAEVVVAEPKAGARAQALKAGAAAAVQDMAQLPRDLDGHVVATPTTLHAAVAEPLLAAGGRVFVEKPLTGDPASARRLAALGADRLFVMEKWRYHPGIQALADAARTGELGRIHAVRSYRLGWGRSQADVDAWWTLLPHDLSIVRHILGALPAACSAAAAAGRSAETDFFAVLADPGEGPTATAEIATSHPLNVRSVVVIGDLGSAQLGAADDDRIWLRRAGDGAQPVLDRSFAAHPPLAAELQAFLGFLRGGPPPMSSAAEGLAVVERIAELRALAGLPGPEGGLPQ